MSSAPHPGARRFGPVPDGGVTQAASIRYEGADGKMFLRSRRGCPPGGATARPIRITGCAVGQEHQRRARVPREAGISVAKWRRRKKRGRRWLRSTARRGVITAGHGIPDRPDRSPEAHSLQQDARKSLAGIERPPPTVVPLAESCEGDAGLKVQESGRQNPVRCRVR